MAQELVCVEKHKQVDARLDGHDKQFDKVIGDIEVLQSITTRSDVVMQNLGKDIQDLVSTLKWGFGLIVAGLIAFVFWYIQNVLK